MIKPDLYDIIVVTLATFIGTMFVTHYIEISKLNSLSIPIGCLIGLILGLKANQRRGK